MEIYTLFHYDPEKFLYLKYVSVQLQPPDDCLCKILICYTDGETPPTSNGKGIRSRRVASRKYPKSPTCSRKNRHSTYKQMPLAFFSLIQSAQMLNTFFPAMSEMHIALQSSSAWLPNFQLKFIAFFDV